MGMSRSDAGKLGALASRKKQLEQYEARIDAYNSSPMLCRGCSDSLMYVDRIRKKVFCSRSCAATFNNKLKHKDVFCIVCKTRCKTTKASFCSAKCHQCFVRKQKIEAGTANFASIKTHLKQTQDYCSMCSISTWLDKPILLIADHIDGNSENNSLANIRLICSNCDATLPTYKSRNKNSGRAYRRERYSSGKSY